MDQQQVTSRRAVVEVLDRDGHVRQVVSVASWPVTIGRAVGCDVVLDDPHVAAQHATLDEVDNTLTLATGQTVNGIRIGARMVGPNTTAALAAGDVLQVGMTRVRVRRAADPVPAEVPLHGERTAGRAVVLALVGATLLWTATVQWLTVDPGEPVSSYVAALAGITVLYVIWAGCWALGSKLFRHRFDFLPHLKVALSYSLTSEVVAAGLAILAFALALPLLSKASWLVTGALVCAMIVAHLGLILPAHRRAAALVIGLLYVAGCGIFMAHTYQTSDRYFPELYVTTLAPPVLRAAGGVTTDRFLDEARTLKTALDEHAKDDDGEESVYWEE